MYSILDEVGKQEKYNRSLCINSFVNNIIAELGKATFINCILIPLSKKNFEKAYYVTLFKK